MSQQRECKKTTTEHQEKEILLECHHAASRGKLMRRKNIKELTTLLTAKITTEKENKRKPIRAFNAQLRKHPLFIAIFK